MHSSLTIERNRKPLLRIVATLFAMIGLVDGKAVERLPLSTYRAVLRLDMSGKLPYIFLHVPICPHIPN